MKKRYGVLLLAVIAFTFGCVRQNYTLQYSFSNTLLDDPIFRGTDSGFSIQMPVRDFTCQTDSVEAVLERDDMEFMVILQGDETEKRCSTTFEGEIAGVKEGRYTVSVVYRVGDTDTRLFSTDLTVEE